MKKIFLNGDFIFTKNNQIVYQEDTPSDLQEDIFLQTDEDLLWFNQKKNFPYWKNLWELQNIPKELEALILKSQSQLFQCMPSFHPDLSNYPQRVLPPEEIIFYPGSFNPFHEGHLQCLKLICSKTPLYLCPDFNPRKSILNRDFPWSFCQMLYRNIQNLENKKIKIYPGFLAKKQTNPTALWVEQVRSQFPNLSIALLMGADSFNTLSSWIESDRLLKSLNSLHIISRLEDTESMKNWIYGHYPHLKLHFHTNNPYQNVSSTKLRNQRTPYE